MLHEWIVYLEDKISSQRAPAAAHEEFVEIDVDNSYKCLIHTHTYSIFNNVIGNNGC